MFSRLWSDQSAMTTIEYALLFLLIAVSALVAWQALSRVTQDNANATSV